MVFFVCDLNDKVDDVYDFYVVDLLNVVDIRIEDL